METLTDLNAALPNSTWTVGDAATHLATIGWRYAGMIAGEANQYPSLAPDICARLNDDLIASISVTDPAEVAALIRDGTRQLVDTSGPGHDEVQIPFHCASTITLPELVAIAAAEHLVHGYDMARATGRPWPIRPDQAALALMGYGPCFGLCLNPQTSAGHTAAYGIELTTGERFTVRFIDGRYQLEPPDSGPLNCTIAADPVALLLVGAGRMSQWAAVTLGHFNLGGSCPELAARFLDLFLFP